MPWPGLTPAAKQEIPNKSRIHICPGHKSVQQNGVPAIIELHPPGDGLAANSWRCRKEFRQIGYAKDPLTLSQRGRIRKRMQLGERTAEFTLRLVLGFLLPVPTRLRVRQQKMQACQGVLARRRTG